MVPAGAPDGPQLLLQWKQGTQTLYSAPRQHASHSKVSLWIPSSQPKVWSRFWLCKLATFPLLARIQSLSYPCASSLLPAVQAASGQAWAWLQCELKDSRWDHLRKEWREKRLKPELPGTASQGDWIGMSGRSEESQERALGQRSGHLVEQC